MYMCMCVRRFVCLFRFVLFCVFKVIMFEYRHNTFTLICVRIDSTSYLYQHKVMIYCLLRLVNIPMTIFELPFGFSFRDFLMLKSSTH